MTVHYDAHGVTLHHGDCLDVLAALPDASVDAVVTDPPYGLEFMGKEWDAPWKHGFGETGYTDGKRMARPNFGSSRNPMCTTCRKHQRGTKRCECSAPTFDERPADSNVAFGQWCTLWAAECLRVLKPGGHLLAFGGTRTWHRLACAIEDAGFEVRDSIAWLYGSGFPKSLDVSKAIDKAAGATREKVRLPSAASAYSANAGNHRPWMDEAAALGYREVDGTAPATPEAATWAGWGTALKPAHEPIVVARKPLAGTVAANVLAHGTGALNVDGCRIGFASAADEAESKGKNQHADFGTEPGGNAVYGDFTMVPRTNYNPPGRWPANVVLDESQAAALDAQSGETSYNPPAVWRTAQDSRDGWGNVGVSQPGQVRTGFGDTGGASRFLYVAKADAGERPRVAGAAHPTVKPIALMRWLVRLVTPPGGVVLEPFAGSGTTVEACLLEGFRCVAVERETDYLPLIVARITRQRDPVAHVRLVGDGQPTLFDAEEPA